MKKEISKFILDCINEYPAEADILEVRICKKYGTIKCYISNYDSPLSYHKEVKMDMLPSTMKQTALEVYGESL